MDGIITYLAGKKTHIIAIAAAITALLEAYGINVPGADMHESWLNYLFASGGISALRMGVASVGKQS